MDEMYRAIERGEMTVEQMLDKVGTLEREFVQEMDKEIRQREAERKEREENSLQLDIDDRVLPPPPRLREIRPLTPSSYAMARRVRKTRDYLHSSGEDLPVHWSIR